jgi:hypothetical protein
LVLLVSDLYGNHHFQTVFSLQKSQEINYLMMAADSRKPFKIDFSQRFSE